MRELRLSSAYSLPSQVRSGGAVDERGRTWSGDCRLPGVPVNFPASIVMSLVSQSKGTVCLTTVALQLFGFSVGVYYRSVFVFCAFIGGFAIMAVFAGLENDKLSYE